MYFCLMESLPYEIKPETREYLIRCHIDKMQFCEKGLEKFLKLHDINPKFSKSIRFLSLFVIIYEYLCSQSQPRFQEFMSVF